MVKGVTRRVVEIKETGSSYFERAIFFVRMDSCKNLSEYTLTQEAKHIIDNFSKGPSASASGDKQKKRPAAMTVLKFIVSAVSGALAAIILMKVW